MTSRVPAPRARSAAVPRHPIQVVARRTGLSADVIRAWEKRYEVVAPFRSDTGRRLYADTDIARLQLLARATLSGRAIGQVAGLAPAALAALVRADAASLARPDVGTGAAATAADAGQLPVSSSADAHLAACLAAVDRFDVVALDVTLRRAAVALSAEAFLDCVVVRVRDAVLERMHRGALRVAQERVALSALRRALDRVLEASASPLAAPELVVTTPLGQTQELGALLAAATAAAEGWHVLYVGPGLPAEAIAETVTQVGARAVTLSLGTAASDRVIPRELRRLRALLAPDVAILVEGAAADAHRGVLREIDAVVLRDPQGMRAALRTWPHARREPESRVVDGALTR